MQATRHSSPIQTTVLDRRIKSPNRVMMTAHHLTIRIGHHPKIRRNLTTVVVASRNRPGTARLHKVTPHLIQLLLRRGLPPFIPPTHTVFPRSRLRKVQRRRCVSQFLFRLQH
uniref:Uncharacterized protein n=1 Tax=Cannabis sativa TaxID=3483 RepID=A0A803QZT0_CANSA